MGNQKEAERAASHQSVSESEDEGVDGYKKGKTALTCTVQSEETLHAESFQWQDSLLFAWSESQISKHERY